MTTSFNIGNVIPDERNPARHPAPQLILKDQTWYGRFQAMASDCLILLEGCSQAQAEQLLRLAAIETWRIEYKYSRYQPDNLMAQINQARETPLALDEETCGLINYANLCYQLSEGLFDISAGVLRKIWRFDGSDKVPSREAIESILPLIGWHKAHWQAPFIQLQAGMELDLGGLGKEYAVDKVLQLLIAESRKLSTTPVAILVNFGGDLACSGPRINQQAWAVAVESHQVEKRSVLNVKLKQGAIATSGDARRFLLKAGVRYSHILNPKTGQAITDAPRSVSVAAGSCMQAGMLSTLAMLQGAQAEAFLQAQEADYWLQH